MDHVGTAAPGFHAPIPALIYYTDYIRYELYSISLRDLPLFLWRNIDGLMLGLGSLVFLTCRLVHP